MSARARAKMIAEGRCRLCNEAAVRLLTRHHLVPQVWFKRRRRVPWTARKLSVGDPRNIVPLCRYCHQAVEGDRGGDYKTRDTRMHEARRLLRLKLLPDELAFIIEARGEHWLARYYPTEVRQHGRGTLRLGIVG